MAIITEEVGSIFDGPSNSILIHACNAKGVWGSGVALEFKKRFPKAYEVYSSHCRSRAGPKFQAGSTRILKPSVDGTTLIIPPQNTPYGNKTPKLDNRYVACLFTSHGYGRTVDPSEIILKHTKSALVDLASQISTLKAKLAVQDGDQDAQNIDNGPDNSSEMKETDSKMILGQCRAVRINSGKFGVPWEETKKILEEGPLDIVVIRPETEESAGAMAGKRRREGVAKTKTRSPSKDSNKEGDIKESTVSRNVKAYNSDASQEAGAPSEDNGSEYEDRTSARSAKRRMTSKP